MSWFRSVTRWITGSRDSKQRELLLEVNRQQLERFRSGETMPRLVDEENTPTVGEATVFSGVVKAAERASAPYADEVDALAEKQATHHGNVTAAYEELARLDRRRHLVGTRSRRGGHHHHDPEASGDSVSVAEAEAELKILTDFLATEKSLGARRHMNAVPTWVAALAVTVLFIDVLALFALTSGLENASFLPADWRRNPVDSATRTVTALGFAALAASVLALLAHFVGVCQWQFIHRRGADATKPGAGGHDGRTAHSNSGLTRYNDALRGAVMPVSWLALITFSGVMGSTMYLRVRMAAESAEKYSDIAGPVGALIALAAVIAPVVVALAAAFRPSPEVRRRDALSLIVSKAEQDRQALSATIQAEQNAATVLVERAEQLRAKADRAVKCAVLPATQSIMADRARYGYAGEQYLPLSVVGDGTRPGLFDVDPISRIDRTLRTMRSATPATPEDPSSSLARHRAIDRTVDGAEDDLHRLDREF